MDRVIGFDCTMSVQDLSFDLGFDSGNNGFNADFKNMQVISGTNDYNPLINKPSINEVVLVGNKTGDQLDLQGKMDVISNTDIEDLLSAFV